jgi:hypothetical protein
MGPHEKKTEEKHDIFHDPRSRPSLPLTSRGDNGARHRTRATTDSLSKPQVSVRDLANFDAATEKARFLFGPEIHSYLGEIRGVLIEVFALGRALPEMPDGPRRTSTEVKVAEALNRLNAFYGKLADLVTPYLRVGPQPPQPWRYFEDRIRGVVETLARRWRRDKR